MPGANVGTAYITISPRFDGLSRSVRRALGGVDASSGAAFGKRFTGGFLRGGAVAGAAATVVSKAMDAIGSSISGAVSRVDTIANFPKVMVNLGYSSQDAQAAIDRLAAGIDGMPTSLDGIVSMTQQLAPLTGGLDKATTLSLALNDAFLAGGASTADQTRAMQQYSQMLSKGTVDLQSWRTLQEVMPGQLDQVSQALLGAGHSSQDLYDALKDGTVSFDDFNDAIIRLDKEGVNGLASFEEQARTATQGIGTAMDNVTNRVNRAVAKVLDAIGQENISGAINAFSSQFGNMAEPIVGLIEGMKSGLEESGAAEAIGKISKQLAVVLPSVGQVKAAFSDFGKAAGDAIGRVLGALSSSGAIGDFARGVESAFGGLQDMLSTLGGALSPIADQLPSMQEAFSALGDVMSGLGDAASQVFGGMQEVFASDAFSGVVSSLADGIGELQAAAGPFVDNVLAPIASVVLPAIGNTIGVVVMVAMTALDGIIGVITTVMNVLSAVPPAIQAVGSWFSSVGATVRAGWTAVVSFFVSIPGQITGFFAPVPGVISGFFDAAAGFVSSIPGRIVGFFSGIAGRIGSTFSSLPGTVSGIFGRVASAVSSIPGRIIGFFRGLGGRISAAIGSIHFPTPHVFWQSHGSGKIRFSLPTVSWYASGAAFSPGNLTLFGAGDAPDNEYMLREAHLSHIADLMRRDMGAQHGGTTNVYIDGARVNDDAAIEAAFRDLMMLLQRKAMMNRG